jgi:Ca-activated chloride channel family protein
MHLPELLLTPLQAAVPAAGGTLDLLLRVQAPDQPEGPLNEATPKRLALVVDRSGSMDGEPLEEALRCVQYIASRLGPQDQLSVVVYDDRIKVLVPLAPVTSHSDIERALSRVASGGKTNLFGGWEAGAMQLEAGEPGSISRVILLSDGQANVGLSALSEIEPHCRQWEQRGVSTTTVGLGRRFNEDLMIGMARAGGGQQYYGQTAADLHDNFDEEFSLLQAIFLQQLTVRLAPADGVIVETLGLVHQNPDGSYRLSDLAWGAEVWMALRLHVSANPKSMPRGEVRDLLAVSVTGVTLEDCSLTVHEMLRLPAVSRASLAELPLDETVQRRMQEVQFALDSQALKDLVQSGKMRAAHALMDLLERTYGKHPWLADKLRRLRALAEEDRYLMEKEVTFSAVRMMSRQSSKADVHYGGDETEAVMPAFLRKKAEEGKGRKK